MAQYASIIECAIMIGTIVIFAVVGVYVWRAFARILKVLPNASAQQALVCHLASAFSFVLQAVVTVIHCFILHPQVGVTGRFSLSITQKVIEAGLVAQKRTQRTVAAVFLLLLFRAAYAFLLTVGFATFDIRSDCAECGECQSTTTVMGVWFISNPSVHIVTTFLSAPVALLLAMYGMLSKNNFLTLIRSQKVSIQQLRDQNSFDALM
jgi:hypothetical protein